MGQNICDRAPATPRTGAAENQCRQHSAAVVRCPGFIGNNFLQVLERHLNYLVSQYELIRTRTMAHFTVDGGRTLGGDRTVDSAFFAVHLSDINPRANAVVWTTTAIEAAEAQWFPARMA